MENLIKIQNELKVPKGKYNSFGKYKYRTSEQILEAVKPLLLKYNATLIITDEIVEIGTKLFLKSTAKINDISVFGFAEMSEHKGMSSEQCSGTASSYARKYALNGLFLIDESEADADSENVKPAPKKKLSDTALKSAIERIAKGEDLIDKLNETFELTETQKVELFNVSQNINR